MRRRVHAGAVHKDEADSLASLGGLLRKMGKSEQAGRCFREALAIARQLSGDGDHPEVAAALNNVAIALHDRGELGSAKEEYEEAISIWTKVHTAEHVLVATGLNNLANLLQQQGDVEGAAEIRRKCMGIERRVFPSNHP